MVDIRNIGLLARSTSRPATVPRRWSHPQSRDELVLSPPLIITKNEIEMVFATLGMVLESIE